MEERYHAAIREMMFHCSKDEMYLLGHEIKNLADWVTLAKKNGDDFRLVFDFNRRQVNAGIEYQGGVCEFLGGGGVGWLLYMLPAMEELGRALMATAEKNEKVSVTWVRDRDSRDHSIRE